MEGGNAHQVHPSPRRDNSQKMGIRQMISRITEIATLTFAAPIAWKNTGVIRENTAEKKLSPIMRNAGMMQVESDSSGMKKNMTARLDYHISGQHCSFIRSPLFVFHVLYVSFLCL